MISAVSAEEPFSLYLHIPYCATKCPYCDFNVHVVRRIPEREYTEALIKELESYAAVEHWSGRRLQSVYFGGGTPSMFEPVSIGRIIDAAESLFGLVENIEITLEANPGAEDRARFPGYRRRGVSRLSVGAQSFQPHLLQSLGRLHSADDVRASLRSARDAGFDNLSLDLIFASPGQSLEDLRSDLEEALRFHPAHVSTYNLTIEEGTPFHRAFRAGKLRKPPEEEEIAMIELIEQSLSRAGLERYEISNYARAGYDSRHNCNYWRCGDYLGLGAGAHSHKKLNGGPCGLRWCNEKNPRRYMERVRLEGRAVVEREEADLARAAGEFMFSGLRMIRGLSRETFRRRFGNSPAEFYPQIAGWIEAGLMEEEEDELRLTRRGLMVANEIFVHFV